MVYESMEYKLLVLLQDERVEVKVSEQGRKQEEGCRSGGPKTNCVRSERARAESLAVANPTGRPIIKEGVWPEPILFLRMD